MEIINFNNTNTCVTAVETNGIEKATIPEGICHMEMSYDYGNSYLIIKIINHNNFIFMIEFMFYQLPISTLETRYRSPI